MKRSAFDEARDLRIANEVGTDRQSMCRASGCPNAWSVNSDDRGLHRLCSAHAWAEPHAWPQVTQEQHDAQTHRVLVKAVQIGQPAKPRLTRDEKAEILLSMRDMFAGQTDPKAWAYRLRDREQCGDRLNYFLRDLWRAVLRERKEIGSAP